MSCPKICAQGIKKDCHGCGQDVKKCCKRCRYECCDFTKENIFNILLCFSFVASVTGIIVMAVEGSKNHLEGTIVGLVLFLGATVPWFLLYGVKMIRTCYQRYSETYVGNVGYGEL